MMHIAALLLSPLTNGIQECGAATARSILEAQFLGLACETAAKASTRPAPTSFSRPFPSDFAERVSTRRTSAGVSEGLRSTSKAAIPLTCAEATDVPVVN